MDEKIVYCQINEPLDILVGKWKPMILMHLFNADCLRFSELKRRIPSITQKMLTKQLRELEAEDIVHREIYAEVPPRVEYSLTTHGRTLKPILDLMHEWGAAHLEHQEKVKKEQE